MLILLVSVIGDVNIASQIVGLANRRPRDIVRRVRLGDSECEEREDDCCSDAYERHQPFGLHSRCNRSMENREFRLERRECASQISLHLGRVPVNTLLVLVEISGVGRAAGSAGASACGALRATGTEQVPPVESG